MIRKHHKSWLSPLMAVLYGIVATSGLLMLFHIKLPGMHSMHEWGGALCIIASIFHLILNWNAFTSYFRYKKAVVGVGAGVLLVVMTLLIPSGKSDHGRGHNRNSASHIFQTSK